MYGTIARLRIKSGMEDQFKQLLQGQAHPFEIRAGSGVRGKLCLSHGCRPKRLLSRSSVREQRGILGERAEA